MRRLLELLMLTLFTLTLAGAAAAFADTGGKHTGKAERSAAIESLTGCVDERNGQYLLADDTDIRPIARLQPAAGTPDNNFARYLGQKVMVRGNVSEEGNLPLVSVKSIEKISSTCAPTPGTP